MLWRNGVMDIFRFCYNRPSTENDREVEFAGNIHFSTINSLVETHWWKLIGGNSLVETHWWKLIGGNSLVETHWWKLIGGNSLVETHWWKLIGGNSLVETILESLKFMIALLIT